MAGKKTEKKGEISQGKPQAAGLRACDHCGEKFPGDQLSTKLVIDYSSGKRSKRQVRVAKGHA